MVLSGALAVRGLAAALYWRDHGNPIFAFEYAVAASVMGLIAVSFAYSFVASEAGVFDRFVSQDSPVLPTVVGLLLLAAGLYGLIVLTDQHVEIEWTLYGAVAGTGIYILKRTFFVGD
jgi:hypothetical protein